MMSFSPEGSDATVTVDPAHGGRIAQLHVRGRELLVGADPSTPLGEQSMHWGSFPMAPWAGRVRRGRFVFDGVEHHLDVNLAPHAIHGTAFTREWDVVLVDDHEIELAVDLDEPHGWDLGGTAHQRIAIEDASVRCELVVRAGDRPMPAELGWHPWFVKPARLTFTPDAMYARDDDGIPTGDLVAAPPGPWDDCFVGSDPIVLHYADLDVTLTSDCDHWVVYDEPVHATCVEPQSGPPDAFNLRPRVLAPGEELRRWYRWAWSAR
jgi:aldose 1-epimerase